MCFSILLELALLWQSWVGLCVSRGVFKFVVFDQKRGIKSVENVKFHKNKVFKY